MAEEKRTIRKVAILFAGGPAPAANAVISAAAVSFIRHRVEVIGIKHGYSAFEEYDPEHPLEKGKHFIPLGHAQLKRTRNSQGIMIGTARTNPGKDITKPDDLDDEEKAVPLKRVYDALRSLDVDALISIGGDDTLKTANKFKLYQDRHYDDEHRIPVVHLPKTIDNDYRGIDFTFGYFTAVDQLATEIRNLLHDAEANRSYFLAECMGRSAGWLAYGAAIAGEASLVLSVEDIKGELLTEEEYKDEEGNTCRRSVINGNRLLDRIVDTILAREGEGKDYGVIVLAEGLAEMLPIEHLKGVKRDEHGHIKIGAVRLYERASNMVMDRYKERTKDCEHTEGRECTVKGIQLGYEVRCAKPTAFDAMLGSQLGVGAYHALAEKGLNGCMVSVTGQLELTYVDFKELVDPDTLVTEVRRIKPGSDFHNLARFLETYFNR